MTELPSSVLFMCNMNSIRSAMAEGLLKKRLGQSLYVQSAGLATGGLEDLMVVVMAEADVDMSSHKPRVLSDLGDTNFDLVITFTQEASDAAHEMFDSSDTAIETWLVPSPTEGSLDVRAMMNSYRVLRDFIDERLTARFPLKDETV